LTVRESLRASATIVVLTVEVFSERLKGTIHLDVFLLVGGTMFGGIFFHSGVTDVAESGMMTQQ